MSDTKLEVVERYGGFTDHRVDTVARHVDDLMSELGLDISSDHLRETPRRVAAMLLYFTQDVNLDAILKDGFETTDRSGFVVQTHIPFKGLCAHHLLPFFGTAAIGYIPRDRVVGLSKLARLVSAAGLRAPTTQEAITDAVSAALNDSQSLAPEGVICATRAVHGCMAVRGVNSPRTETIVISERRMSPENKQTFLQLIGSDW